MKKNHIKIINVLLTIFIALCGISSFIAFIFMLLIGIHELLQHELWTGLKDIGISFIQLFYASIFGIVLLIEYKCSNDIKE